MLHAVSFPPHLAFSKKAAGELGNEEWAYLNE